MARSSKRPAETEHPAEGEKAPRGVRRSGGPATPRSKGAIPSGGLGARASTGGSRSVSAGSAARRSNVTWVVFALAAGMMLFLAGWTVATTTGPGHTPTSARTIAQGSLSSGGATSSGRTESPRPTFHCGVAEPTATLLLPHVNSRLEDKLPSIIGQVCLYKFSTLVSTYVASATGGDKALYTPWLKRFNKTPAEVQMAFAADLTEQENFNMRAIQVPGATATALSQAFAEVAAAAGWTVVTHANYLPGKSALQVIDPDKARCGSLCSGVIYASGDVLYTIITDQETLITETMIWLP